MSFPILLAQSADSGNAVQQIARDFGVVSWLFISQCFSFAIVCIVLHKFAYKRVLDVLDQRRRTIEQGLADAARSKEPNWPPPKKRSAEILQRASAEAQKIVDEARTAAKAYQDKQTQQAVREAEQIIARAR